MASEWMDDSAKAMTTFKFLSRRLNFGALNDAQMLALNQLAARNSGWVPKPSVRTTCRSHRAHSTHSPLTANAERSASSDLDFKPDSADPGPDPDPGPGPGPDPDPGLRLKRRLPDDTITIYDLTKRCKVGSGEGIDDRSNVRGDDLQEVRRRRISIALCGRTLMTRVVAGFSSGISPDVHALRDSPSAPQRLSAGICFRLPSRPDTRAR